MLVTYIVKDISLGLYKIGYTTNMRARFATLKTSNLSLRFVMAIPDFHETFLHKLYAPKRVGGEFFKLTDKDIDDLKNFKDEVVRQLKEQAEPDLYEDYGSTEGDISNSVILLF